MPPTPPTTSLKRGNRAPPMGGVLPYRAGGAGAAPFTAEYSREGTPRPLRPGGNYPDTGGDLRQPWWAERREHGRLAGAL